MPPRRQGVGSEVRHLPVSEEETRILRDTKGLQNVVKNLNCLQALGAG